MSPLTETPGALLYENPFSEPKDLEGFVMEGRADAVVRDGALEMKTYLTRTGDRHAHCVYWCPYDFPPDVGLEWEFTPVAARGLCMIFFAATGKNGEDLFNPALPERAGYYDQYHSGAINAFHASYYRRTGVESLNLSVLRKSAGFHKVAWGADPLPMAELARPPYRMRLTKLGRRVTFAINDLQLWSFDDDGDRYGPLLGGGKIGFRQMAPMVGRYANLRVHGFDGTEQR
jgi:hypothetical protein